MLRDLVWVQSCMDDGDISLALGRKRFLHTCDTKVEVVGPKGAGGEGCSVSVGPTLERYDYNFFGNKSDLAKCTVECPATASAALCGKTNTNERLLKCHHITWEFSFKMID